MRSFGAAGFRYETALAIWPPHAKEPGIGPDFPLTLFFAALVRYANAAFKALFRVFFALRPAAAQKTPEADCIDKNTLAVWLLPSLCIKKPVWKRGK
jgi:hypothetical protein